MARAVAGGKVKRGRGMIPEGKGLGPYSLCKGIPPPSGGGGEEIRPGTPNLPRLQEEEKAA